MVFSPCRGIFPTGGAQFRRVWVNRVLCGPRRSSSSAPRPQRDRWAMSFRVARGGRFNGGDEFFAPPTTSESGPEPMSGFSDLSFAILEPAGLGLLMLAHWRFAGDFANADANAVQEDK